MITIEVKKAVKVQEKEAMFISFPYSMEIVSKVKSLKTRYYNPPTKSWEVPMRELDNVLSIFQDKELKIIAPTAKTARTAKAVKKVENRVKFESTAAKDFQFKTKPFDHQVEAFKYALNCDKFLLGDEQERHSNR